MFWFSANFLKIIYYICSGDLDNCLKAFKEVLCPSLPLLYRLRIYLKLMFSTPQSQLVSFDVLLLQNHKYLTIFNI